MKTTYPPATAADIQEWEQYAKKNINQWYGHVHTLRDNPAQLDRATKERQLYALQKKLESGTVKNYFALKNKIEQLKKAIKEEKEDQNWQNYLAQ